MDTDQTMPAQEATEDPNPQSPTSVKQSRLRTTTEATNDLGNSPPRPLTVPQVAAELGVSGEHVRRLIGSGELTAYAIGMGERRHYRVTPHALKSYRERHQTARRIGGRR